MMNNIIVKFEKFKKRRATVYLLLHMLFLSVGLNAQDLTVKGKVIDFDGNPLPGTAVMIKGTATGVTSNDDGDYILSNVPAGGTLEFQLIGYVTQEIAVNGRTAVNAIMTEASTELEEVVYVAFDKQSKESVTSAITSINPQELRVPSSNLTTAFAGRIAGMIAYQRTGEPGQDNAEFYIRGITTFGVAGAKKDPLILIDGVEMTADDLARLTTDDIASFSIMKDANATALYGARGANGVVLVKTKEGNEGKLKIQFRAEGSTSASTENMKLANPVTYMRMHNEAVHTRTPMAGTKYSSEQIYNTERGVDPVRYPAVDWLEMLFNDYTVNQRYNLSASGGGPIARYYIAASYSRDNGIIKMDKRNSFNNNIAIDRYMMRSNVNVNLSKTTEAVVRLHAFFDDYSGPLDGGSELYNKALNSSQVDFLPYYQPDEKTRYYTHILFGNYGDGKNQNPYADMVKGYKSTDRSNMSAQFELKQNFGFITQGLSARAMFNVNRYSLLTKSYSYKPYYYSLMADSDTYELLPLNPDDGREWLEPDGDPGRTLTSSMYFEGAVQYNRSFDKHSASGLLVYTLRESVDGAAADLQGSLPHRNLGLAGRATYGYDSRYFFEFNFGYNGSERFARNNRFGFFPSAGAGWIVSNEKFWQPFKKTVSKLKFRATYGLVGNDQIGKQDDRFFYISKVNPNDASRGYSFGGPADKYTRSGVSIGRYADPGITWEISRKTNFGIEINLWKSLEIQADLFTEKRTNILQERADIPVTMGLWVTPFSNIGEASGHGFDMSVDYNKSFGKDIWATVRGNFTYASSKYDLFEEPNYIRGPRRARTGQKLSQGFGLVAERLFLDEEEVANSPSQRAFEDYGAGDIKYKDINGDKQIDSDDIVPIGYPTTPEIVYGFGLSAGYKNLDFSCFFQGSARSSFWVDPVKTAPFVKNRAMMQYWVDDHWSENDRNIFAMWPRLSEEPKKNNTQTSTWFMRNGAFLRMKTAEIGYRLPHSWISRIKMQNVRMYLSCNNLFVISKFNMWDIEMAGNGLAYPIQRVFNFGINIDF
jgi:TonB-linked SusC/RagA family outer membrane protein